MRRKIMALLMTAACVLSLAGSTVYAEETEMDAEVDEEADAAEDAEEDAQEDAAANDFQMKVGICLSDHTNTSFIAMLDAAREYAAEQGNITIIEQDGQSDAETMVSAIENFINSGCDAIIYQNSFPEVTNDIIKEAADSGICVIAYEAENDDATLSWVSDNDTIGRAIGNMAGEWINENCDGKGYVCVICNDSIEFLKARGDAMVEGLMEVAPDSEVVARQPARDITDGYTLAETLLNSNPEINCYVATGDAAAVGVSEAYEAANWTEPLGTFGADCTDEAIAAMKSDDSFVGGSIDFRLEDQMIEMLKAAYNYCADGTLDDTVVVMELTPVTADNVNDYYPDEEEEAAE